MACDLSHGTLPPCEPGETARPMLVRVPCDQVVLGMFVHSMEGSWLDHPFWRKKFVLNDPEDLAKLKASAVPAILIDDAKGIGLATPPVTIAASPAPLTRAATVPQRRPIEPLPPRAVRAEHDQPCSIQEEAARAGKIVKKSKEAVMRMFGEARLGKAVSAAAVAPLVDEIASSVARNPSALIGIARLKNKDEYTYMHSVAVCALMINLARTLELDEEVVREAGMAGLLHDVGKMMVPDEVLNKRAKLTDDEFAMIREHPARGHELLLQSDDVPAGALDVALHHHEKLDGRGYPFGLKGDEISLFARMGAICDVYDAITSERAYKEAWSPADSITRMQEWSGHFDEALLVSFIRSIGIYPVGTLVRMRSNRLAVVLADNPRNPTLPKVRVFYSIMDRAIVPHEDIAVTDTLKGDQIISREIPERWRLEDWGALCAKLLAQR